MFKKNAATLVRKHCVLIRVIVTVLFFACPAMGIAETIDGNGDFDALLIEILDVLESSVLTFAAVGSIIVYGCGLAFFPNNHDTFQRGARIILGLIIAAKGAGFVTSALGLSFLI